MSEQLEKNGSVDQVQADNAVLFQANVPSGEDLRRAAPDTAIAAGFPSIDIGEDNHQSKAADGPSFTTDQRLDGPVQVRQPSEAGNAEQAIDLIRSGQFQNADGSLTNAAAESIRTAIANTNNWRLQSYEDRAAQVERYINENTGGARISLQVDRDHANRDTRMGSQPFIRATIGGQTSNIRIRR